MNIKEKIDNLREKMKKNNLKAYLIPTSDYHQSEYIGNYFKVREFMSGFTGSAGTLVVFLDEAILWTDGRYYVQAEKQLENSTITLFKDGTIGVPTFAQYIAKKLGESDTLGFDAKFCSTTFIKNILSIKNIRLQDIDLISDLWTARESLSKEKIFIFEEKYAGLSYKNKLEEVLKDLSSKNAKYNIITSLDDIAWLFNIRGRDVKNNPVALAFSIISNEKSILYIDKDKLDSHSLEYFEKNDVIIKNYFDIFDDVKNISDSVLLDENKVSYAIYSNLKNVEIINSINPSSYLKAHKNEIEIENTKICHILDGVAVTKFMYYIKNNFDKLEISEYDAGKKIDFYRSEIADYLEPSFDTISAFNENAAMMHYKASFENSSKITNGTLLVDSGGQYLRGTTDITRTFFLGNVKEEIKRDNTLVLKGMLALTRAKFLFGVTGTNLDILARQFLWQNAIDYKCGTGHGVGHCLNVHEGPHGIRVQYNSQRLEENMIVTNEPGVYIKNSHGIRIENELLVKKFIESEHGTFMQFENLTFAPIDLDGILANLLTEEEKNQLNSYHSEVFEKLSPYLDEEHKIFLKQYTKAI